MECFSGNRYVQILTKKSIPIFDASADIAQKVERRTREHHVSDHYRLWVRIPGRPTKITNVNSLSDETLNRGSM